MKANFTFDEMVYNSIVAGRQFHYDEDGDGIEEIKTISYVKLMKATRQVQIHCVDGDVMLANQDDEFTFEVLGEKIKVEPNRKKVKKVNN